MKLLFSFTKKLVEQFRMVRTAIETAILINKLIIFMVKHKRVRKM
mgnify:CR=1